MDNRWKWFYLNQKEQGNTNSRWNVRTNALFLYLEFCSRIIPMRWQLLTMHWCMQQAMWPLSIAAVVMMKMQVIMILSMVFQIYFFYWCIRFSKLNSFQCEARRSVSIRLKTFLRRCFLFFFKKGNDLKSSYMSHVLIIFFLMWYVVKEVFNAEIVIIWDNNG